MGAKPLHLVLRLLLALVLLAATAALVAGCGDDGDGDDGPRAGNALAEPPLTDWITNGGSIFNDRYSKADQLTPANIKNLKGEWLVRLNSGRDAKYSGEAQPIVHGDTIYVITGEDDVFALDLATGKKKWDYQGNLDEKITTVCCGWTSRGVGYGDGKVYVGRLDGKLMALDAKTGKVVWNKQVDRWQDGYTITSAPLYFDGLVFTGVSGGEFGIRGHVTAYDAKTGEQKWRFHLIPAPGERGSETWPKGSNFYKNGGVPMWQTPALDPELGLMYFSTGNTSPDFNGAGREGDNLYADSIMAVDYKTGAYKWHFQQVHHDIWDYDSPNPIILFDREIDGEPRKGLAQASKTGWVYILDRETGKPLIGIDEKPVPQEPKQKTAKTQPYPRGDAFVPQSIPKSEVPKGKGFKWVNGGKIFTPFWEEGIIAKPGTLGGANWPPSSYNPKTGFMYVCASDYMSIFKTGEDETEYNKREIRKGNSFLGSEFTSPKGEKPIGTFTAMNTATNKIAWQKKWTDGNCYSGSITTAGGLVFTGRNSGELIAYDAKSGKQLWSFQTGAGANSTATTFERNGKQYVVFYAAGNTLAGSKHGDNVWLFSLDGDLSSGSADKNREDNAAVNGEELYATNCSACHGLSGAGGHNGPQLQGVTMDVKQLMEQIRNGSGAMPAFKDRLNEREIEAIAKYVRSQIIPGKVEK